eukprot:4319109-Amphidinium_carterae.1
MSRKWGYAALGMSEAFDGICFPHWKSKRSAVTLCIRWSSPLDVLLSREVCTLLTSRQSPFIIHVCVLRGSLGLQLFCSSSSAKALGEFTGLLWRGMLQLIVCAHFIASFHHCNLRLLSCAVAATALLAFRLELYTQRQRHA